MNAFCEMRWVVRQVKPATMAVSDSASVHLSGTARLSIYSGPSIRLIWTSLRGVEVALRGRQLLLHLPRHDGCHRLSVSGGHLQEYLAHDKQRPPRTLQ